MKWLASLAIPGAIFIPLVIWANDSQIGLIVLAITTALSWLGWLVFGLLRRRRRRA